MTPSDPSTASIEGLIDVMSVPAPAGGASVPADVVVAAGAVVVPDGVLRPGWVRIVGDRLGDVGAGAPPRPADVELPDGWLIPGFVDLHVHGGGGHSAADGPEQAASAAGFHRRHGTTTMLASLVTADHGELCRSVAALADLVVDGIIAGIHLEGPWLAESRCGAHDPRLLRPPTPADVAAVLDAGRGRVRVVTLAPELPGGLAAVRQVAAAGAVAAVGHTDADHTLTREAIAAGARLATHLFNAMPPIHHREPGPVPALLAAEEVAVELVLDGVHVHPAVAALAVHRAGPDRTVLVTDAIAAAGAGDGDYRLGTLAVRVDDGVARLVDGGAIAGSTLTMDAAWRFAVQACGLPPEDASRAASATPARLLGLAGVTGSLVPGLRADVVALDAELQITRVMAGGRWVR